MRKFKNIIGWISIVCCLLIAIGCIAFRLFNSELTETQLMMKTWWVFIPFFILAYGFYWGFNED